MTEPRTQLDEAVDQAAQDGYVQATTANPERYENKAPDGGQCMIYRRAGDL